MFSLVSERYEILTECMLKWDIKSKSSTGKGILGTVRAFAGANEEQGRKTLHRHWQIWVETSINHYKMLCLIKTTTQGTKLDKNL